MTKAPRVPGAVPADLPADDLADLADGGELPKADPVMLEMAAMRAELAQLKRAQPAQAAAKPEATKLDAKSQDEARAMAEQEVAKGRRPRALLTPDGWYAHPEMARQPGSLGNLKA